MESNWEHTVNCIPGPKWNWHQGKWNLRLIKFIWWNLRETWVCDIFTVFIESKARLLFLKHSRFCQFNLQGDHDTFTLNKSTKLDTFIDSSFIALFQFWRTLLLLLLLLFVYCYCLRWKLIFTFECDFEFRFQFRKQQNARISSRWNRIQNKVYLHFMFANKLLFHIINFGVHCFVFRKCLSLWKNECLEQDLFVLI